MSNVIENPRARYVTAVLEGRWGTASFLASYLPPVRDTGMVTSKDAPAVAGTIPAKGDPKVS